MSKQNFEPVYLCKCNNCGTVMLDQNAQVGAPIFMADVKHIADMQYMKEDGTEEYFWGCGICDTDSFLTDEIGKDTERVLRHDGVIQ